MNQKINVLYNKIKLANLETIKAKAYSEGYLDCIKDMLNNENNDLNKILSIKNDALIKREVYEELLPILEDILNDNVDTEKNVDNMHPSERARAFLERIGRT